MVLAKSMVYAIENNNDIVSGVKIYCDSSITEEVSTTFMEIFNEKWKSALDEFENWWGSIDDIYGLPILIRNTEYGLFVKVFTLAINDLVGEVCDLDQGKYALDYSLKAVKEQYPSIEYEGFIAYSWSDSRDGDVEQYEVSSNETDGDKVYDFVGEVIGKLLKECGCFWTDTDLEELYGWDKDDYVEIAQSLYAYKDWIDPEDMDSAFNRIIDMLSQDTPEIREDLVKQILAGEKI